MEIEECSDILASARCDGCCHHAFVGEDTESNEGELSIPHLHIHYEHHTKEDLALISAGEALTRNDDNTDNCPHELAGCPFETEEDEFVHCSSRNEHLVVKEDRTPTSVIDRVTSGLI